MYKEQAQNLSIAAHVENISNILNSYSNIETECNAPNDSWYKCLPYFEFVCNIDKFHPIYMHNSMQN